jgi:hypothetical protein
MLIAVNKLRTNQLVAQPRRVEGTCIYVDLQHVNLTMVSGLWVADDIPRVNQVSNVSRHLSNVSRHLSAVGI